MKLLLFGLCLFLPALSSAQKPHIPQSLPFEQVLMALQTDDAPLFTSSFSQGVIQSESKDTDWSKLLEEAKEKFQERFQRFRLEDFTYIFDRQNSTLEIYFRGEKQFAMQVVREDKIWKLDEH